MDDFQEFAQIMMGAGGLMSPQNDHIFIFFVLGRVRKCVELFYRNWPGLTLSSPYYYYYHYRSPQVPPQPEAGARTLRMAGRVSALLLPQSRQLNRRTEISLGGLKDTSNEASNMIEIQSGRII